MKRLILTLKNPPKLATPEPVASAPVAVITVQAILPEPHPSKEPGTMRVVDRHGNFSILKRDIFEKRGTKLIAVGADFFVRDDEVLKTTGLAMALSASHSTLSAARQSIGRVVPDNNVDKTKPASAYAAFSGPKASRAGAAKK